MILYAEVFEINVARRYMHIFIKELPLTWFLNPLFLSRQSLHNTRATILSGLNDNKYIYLLTSDKEIKL
jgi:hypothetical protein